jgi:hypothetical protein
LLIPDPNSSDLCAEVQAIIVAKRMMKNIVNMVNAHYFQKKN